MNVNMACLSTRSGHFCPLRCVWLKNQQVLFLRALHKFHLYHKITENVLLLLNYKEPLGLFPTLNIPDTPSVKSEPWITLHFNCFNSEMESNRGSSLSNSLSNAMREAHNTTLSMKNYSFIKHRPLSFNTIINNHVGSCVKTSFWFHAIEL